MLQITQRSGNIVALPDGAVGNQGHIWGTHLHGLFDNKALLLSWVNSLRERKGLSRLTLAKLPDNREEKYDNLAEAVRHQLNMKQFHQKKGFRGMESTTRPVPQALITLYF